VLAFSSPWAEIIEIQIFNNSINVIFFIDILIELRTTYIDAQSGEEIYDPKKIAKTYIKSLVFYIDVLAIIPFDKMLQVASSKQ